MLKYGSNNIGKVYLGSNSIGKAYYGGNLVFQKGVSPTPPGPEPPGPEPEPGQIYQLPEQKTSTFDTGVKLFDTPKSFTIYFDATFTNYNWTTNQRLVGLDQTSLFGLGRISTGKDYQSNALVETTNRYTAVIMNPTSSSKQCSSILARNSSSQRRKFAITYDVTTRKVAGYSSDNSSFNHWYILSSDLVSDLTLKVLINIASTGTVHDLKIYNYCMTDSEVDALIGVFPSSE